MILITPRSPDEAILAGNPTPGDEQAQTAMEALRALHPSWFEVESDSATVLRELTRTEFHRYFRTGDLRLQPRDRADGVLGRLQQLLRPSGADEGES